MFARTINAVNEFLARALAQEDAATDPAYLAALEIVDLMHHARVRAAVRWAALHDAANEPTPLFEDGGIVVPELFDAMIFATAQDETHFRRQWPALGFCNISDMHTRCDDAINALELIISQAVRNRMQWMLENKIPI